MVTHGPVGSSDDCVIHDMVMPSSCESCHCHPSSHPHIVLVFLDSTPMPCGPKRIPRLGGPAIVEGGQTSGRPNAKPCPKLYLNVNSKPIVEYLECPIDRGQEDRDAYICIYIYMRGARTLLGTSATLVVTSDLLDR